MSHESAKKWAIVRRFERKGAAEEIVKICDSLEEAEEHCQSVNPLAMGWKDTVLLLAQGASYPPGETDSAKDGDRTRTTKHPKAKVRVNCPGCGETLEVEVARLGRTGVCRFCESAITIPLTPILPPKHLRQRAQRSFAHSSPRSAEPTAIDRRAVFFWTAVFLAVTLVCPWTQFDYYHLEGERIPRTVYDSYETHPYPFFMETRKGAKSQKHFLWTYTAIQAGAILILGIGFAVGGAAAMGGSRKGS